MRVQLGVRDDDAPPDAKLVNGTGRGSRAAMKRILVAVDASQTSKLVVARAADLAQTTAAKLRLVRAVPIQQPPLLPMPGVILMPPAGQTEGLVAAAQASLDALQAEIPE